MSPYARLTGAGGSFHRAYRASARRRSLPERATVLEMCRIAGYLGSPVSLDTILTLPKRSLVHQARDPHELPPGVTGSDGFGIGWFPEEVAEASQKASAARFRSTLPIWADENVPTLVPHVRSACFVASSRTASRRMPVAILNTPPFVAGDGLLVHNGVIEHFHAEVLETLRAQLHSDTRARIYGNTDSEYLAGLLGDRTERELVDRVRALLDVVGHAVRKAGVTAQLNLIVAERRELVATRFALGTRQPSLAIRTAGGSTAFASEPMDDEGWSSVDESTLVRVGADGAPTFARV